MTATMLARPDTSEPNDLDDFLIYAAIRIGRVADDVAGALLILAFYADADGSRITPTELIAAWGCSLSKYMLDRAGIAVPAAWRLV
jgi:hypothetical protein